MMRWFHPVPGGRGPAGYRYPAQFMSPTVASVYCQRSDVITTLAVFGTRYEENRWLTFLQSAVPGCTELEAQWLISHPAPVDSPLPAPQSRNKRKASISGGSKNLSCRPERSRSPLPPLSPHSDN